jgi:hypothetical protein
MPRNGVLEDDGKKKNAPRFLHIPKRPGLEGKDDSRDPREAVVVPRRQQEGGEEKMSCRRRPRLAGPQRWRVVVLRHRW